MTPDDCVAFAPWVRPCAGGVLALMSLIGCLEPGRVSLAPSVSEQPSSPMESSVAYYGEGVALGASVMRRLTQSQIKRSLINAFGEGLLVPEISEPDISEAGLLSVGAGSTTYSARGISSLEESSYLIAQQVINDPALSERAIPCELSTERAADEEQCQYEALSLSGLRLWRRPLEPDELARLMMITQRASETLDNPREGLVFGLAALIQSPHFLYRAEVGRAGEPRAPLDPFGLAARLSYLLWDSAPDDELLSAARDGELSTEEGLRRQAERLLSAPQAREGVAQFFNEQLRLYELSETRKDPLIFEQYDPQLMRDAREETLQLLLHLVFDQGGDYRDLMTTQASFLNPRLAALYRLPAPSQEGFKLVSLPDSSMRAGLLSHASVLSLNAHPTSSSATLRGKFVRTVLLCQSIPPPPVGVDTAIPEPSGDSLTLRERVAEHLENPSCAGCHQLLDPIGLGLENYDSIGRWRTTDNGAEIDASGELDQRPFDDPRSLGRLIRDHPQFAPCVVRTLSRYAMGRMESPSERVFLEDLSARFGASGYRFKALMLSLIMSPLFREVGAPK